MCGFLAPKPLPGICKLAVGSVAKTIQALLEKGGGPDDACLAIKSCTDPTCRLFPAQAYKRPVSLVGASPEDKAAKENDLSHLFKLVSSHVLGIRRQVRSSAAQQQQPDGASSLLEYGAASVGSPVEEEAVRGPIHNLIEKLEKVFNRFVLLRLLRLLL